MASTVSAFDVIRLEYIFGLHEVAIVVILLREYFLLWLIERLLAHLIR